MFYSFLYPILLLLCLCHQNYLRLLVIMRLRPSLLLKAKIRPATHYSRACHLISLIDMYSLHVMSSYLSALYALHLFEKTRALPYKQGELKLLSSCTQNTLQWRNRAVKIFIYPQASSTVEKVLLLHGWDGRSIMFRHLAKHLQQQGYAVIAPDLPAHGVSKGSKVSFYDLASFVLHLEAYYGKFSIVIGHSTGGLISCMAALQGLSFKGLVLMSSPGSYGDMVDKYVSANRLPARIASSMKRIYQLRYGLHPDQICPALYQDIEKPVLILHDMQDLSISLDSAKALHKAFSRSKLITTQNKGHNGALRDAATLENISNFISGAISEEFFAFDKHVFRKKTYSGRSRNSRTH
ncbi:alpha/beta fold hydrolase [Pantoea stewartii]|uniref:alpha/beta fold hydrolase n=1 Tax=Pantoea stewartii TaxID=66269 RepID=UPI0021E8A720|nr:alpha/beta hydrolase [Pantoea stewartii]UYK98831.1 alpha/beta hydrolase [Pantoea stewartii]